MKLTVVAIRNYDKQSQGKLVNFTSLQLESEEVLTKSQTGNWFDTSKRVIAKTIKTNVMGKTSVEGITFPVLNAVGDTFEGFEICTKHSFIPNQTAEQEAARVAADNTAKLQNFSFSKNTKKIYFVPMDGKKYVFFSSQEFHESGVAEAEDVTFPEIGSAPMLPGMELGRRPTEAELALAGLSIHPDTKARWAQTSGSVATPVTQTPPAAEQPAPEQQPADPNAPVNEQVLAANTLVTP